MGRPAPIGSLCQAFLTLILVFGLSGEGLAQNNASPILPGGNSKQPINIDAEKLDYFDKEQKLIYSGNVVAVQGDSQLKASRLVIFLTPKSATPASDTPAAAASTDVRRMEAAGPVTLISKDQIGTGDTGLYEKSEDKVYLNGNVTLSQKGNVTKGDHLIYDLKTSQAVVGGRVRSMFLPKGSALPQATAKSP
jgi:lipopolysaccharide export system protein LptA